VVGGLDRAIPGAKVAPHKTALKLAAAAASAAPLQSRSISK
jgi:hypothetical protein